RPVQTATAARLVGLLSPSLRAFEFTPGAPARRDDSLDVPFVLHYDEGRTAPPREGEPAPGQDPARHSDGKRGTVHLRQVAGRWRVSGLPLPGEAGGAARPLAFEQLAAVWAPPRPAPAPAGFDPIVPITPAELDAAWQVDVDVKDRPALEVLQPLVEGTGR